MRFRRLHTVWNQYSVSGSEPGLSMRFDEFTAQRGVAVIPVDKFAGFIVQVEVPSGWELFAEASGMAVWINTYEISTSEFCTNAVLTMNRVEALLDPPKVFAMLNDQQLQSVPGCRELRRDLADATEGDGVVGLLAVEIDHELGTIESVSRTRIVRTEQETMIAQLTVTALQESAANGAPVWLTMRPNTAAVSAAPVHHHGDIDRGKQERH